MNKINVYAIGNALVDIEYQTSPQKLASLGIEKGVMTLIDEQRQNSLMTHLGDSHERMACGGSAANTIIAMAHLGASVHLDCRVANDMAGRFFARDLKNSGVESGLATGKMSGGVTGKCLVFVTPDADRTMNTFLGASAELDTGNIDEIALRKSSYIYIEGYLVSSESTRAAAIAALTIARNRGIKTALTLSDPNMVLFFREEMRELIGSGVDLLFSNEDEACEFAQTSCLDDALDSLKSIAGTFVVTRGKNGALLFDGSNYIEIAPHQVDAIDTLGAGDLFAGAFLYGLTHDMSFKRCGELASLASSRIVTQYGPRLDAKDTQALLAKFLAGN